MLGRLTNLANPLSVYRFLRSLCVYQLNLLMQRWDAKPVTAFGLDVLPDVVMPPDSLDR
jgi:hypothetical protein